MHNKELISVTEAKSILAQQQFQKKPIRLSLSGAVGYVLAEDIFSPVDIPSFNQSSMDGYAFAFDDWHPGDQFKVSTEVQAGRGDKVSINKGEAVRIFTGAALPDGTDTVIMQEQTSVVNGQIEFLQKDLKRGDNNRLKGSDIRTGELAMPALSELTAAAIGFLSGLGITEVPVFAHPSVSLVITGDELQQPGKPLQFGQVYEASSTMLKAALYQMGIHHVSIFYSKDTLDETVKTMQQALATSDVVFITGGVSVGDYDFVVQASKKCEIQQLFHRVKQRPGKPLFAGRKGDQPVFGLPGNPSSVLTCFYQYVWPLLRRMMGYEVSPMMLKAPLADAYDKKHQLTHFLKGNFENGKVSILPGQESYRMRSFAVANCFLVLDETIRHYDKEELVDIYLLPVYG